MGKRGPRRNLEDEQVLDAALAVVAEGGVDALTMSALAERLEFSVSGLYRYVDDLGDLVFRLQQRAVQRYDDGLRDHMELLEQQLGKTKKGNQRSRSLARVLGSFLYYLEHRRTCASEHRLLDAFLSQPQMQLDDEGAVAIGEIVTRILGRCGETLLAASSLGALQAGDPAVRTHQVWAALHGLMHFEKRDRIQPPSLKVAALVEPLLTTFLVGFGADPKEVGKAWEIAEDGAMPAGLR